MDRTYQISINNFSPTWGKDVLIISFILFLFFFFQLGNRPLATPDEGRYVEIPREMVVSGDYITPRLNNVKYFEKPPLFYWLQALTLKAFGFSESYMRIWQVIFAIIGCLATYAFGRQYFDRYTGFGASFILGGSVLYFCMGRFITLDMSVSVLVTVILYSFYHALQIQENYKRRLWIYLFGIFCALGVLTKGIMALAIPGPIIVLWLTFSKQWNKVLPLYIFSSLLIFFAVCLPWHILVSIKNPEFAYKYFIVEHFLRYTSTVHLRYQPIWFFFPIILVGFLPWTTFIPGALYKAWQNKINPLNSFLLIWVIWTFSFFSFSNSKLIPYILPLFAPMALLITQYLKHLKNFDYKNIRVLFGHAILCLTIACFSYTATFLFPELLAEKSDLLFYIDILRAVFLIHGISMIFIIKSLQKELINGKWAIFNVAVSNICIILIVIFASPYIQRPSIKPLAEIINQSRNVKDKVVSYMAYYQDLPVYTDSIVTVVEATGELEFGTLVEDTSQWMIKEKQFIDIWPQSQKLWVISRKSELDNLVKKYPTFQCKIIAEANENVLFTQN